MRRDGIKPSGAERHFDVSELIVSKTDTKGVITYANDVFVRVSGYAEHEILGQPHNIIRHPDMPRSVFKLMWDTIQAGEEIFAYVNNLAADGANYWVFAHITPSYDPRGQLIGYHSNRRAPDRDAVQAAAALYRDIHVVEARHAKPADAIAAGLEEFGRRLDALGMTYDEFVWSLTKGKKSV